LQQFLPRAVQLSRIKAIIAPQSRVRTRATANKQSWHEQTQRQDKIKENKRK